MVDEYKKQGNVLALNLGKRIAEQRKQIGWTQASVAEKVGVDTETISRFERGCVPAITHYIGQIGVCSEFNHSQFVVSGFFAPK
ncbi:MAG: helix-turn-helix transcriptional regulator [Nitrosomonadales bacterium]